jgi:hypothetical protein
VLALAACRSAAPPPAGREHDLVSRLAVAVLEPQRLADLFDLELRQRADLFAEITAAPGPERLRVLEAARPRMGDTAALETLRAEATAELRTPLRQALAGKTCRFGPPAPEDVNRYDRFDLPEPKPEMGPHVGQFLFDLRKEIGYITKGRITCAGGVSAFAQLVKRRGADKPLKILRIAP